METTQLTVSGMNCGACVNHVTKALREVPGVQEVGVDLASGTATVRHSDSLQSEALVDAVSEAGYGAEVTGG